MEIAIATDNDIEQLIQMRMLYILEDFKEITNAQKQKIEQQLLKYWFLFIIGSWTDEKFEAYPDFTSEKAKEEIAFRSKNDEFFVIELKSIHKVIGYIYLGKRDFNTRE